jgi:hypothetical protein
MRTVTHMSLGDQVNVFHIALRNGKGTLPFKIWQRLMTKYYHQIHWLGFKLIQKFRIRIFSLVKNEIV